MTNSKVAEDIWFNYLYLKLRFIFACTNYIQSTATTSDHVVSITQTNTLLDHMIRPSITYANTLITILILIQTGIVNTQYWIDNVKYRLST